MTILSPVPKRRPGFSSATAFLRLAMSEAAIVGGAALSGGPRPAGVAAAVGAVTLLAVASGRQRGRWWVEQRGVAWRYRRRRGAGTEPHADARLRVLRSLAPGLAFSAVDVADGSRIGVGHDAAGWYAAAELTLDSEARLGAATAAMTAALLQNGPPGAVLHLVTHTVPAPSGDLDPGCPASRSYRELFEQTGPIPAERVRWAVVRTDVEVLAAAGVRDIDQAPAIVAGLVRRIARHASRHGVSASFLNPGELLAALARSCGLDGAAREAWSAWHSGRLAHVSFWVRDWPDLGADTVLLDRLASIPAAFTSLTLSVTNDQQMPSSDAVDIRCLIRIATKPSNVDRTTSTLMHTAHTLGLDLVTLDGEQGPATYASAPTGGGPR